MWGINEGVVDRVIRAVLGIGVLALAFVGPKTVWGMLGVIPLATAIVGFCPLYKLVGINTCKRPPTTPTAHGT
jgi:hypothetical protein